MWLIKLGQAFLKILDGLETVIYAIVGAVLLVGSGVWIFMRVYEINPPLAIVGAASSTIVIWGAVVRNLIRRRLSGPTKVVLAAWALCTFVALGIDLVIMSQS